jgi:hypothetical protein
MTPMMIIFLYNTLIFYDYYSVRKYKAFSANRWIECAHLWREKQRTMALYRPLLLAVVLVKCALPVRKFIYLLLCLVAN